MALTREEVLNVAKLARLKFKDEEIEKFQIELNEILGYVEVLNEVDTENVEALTQINHNVNNLREDIVKKSLEIEKVVKNAPDSDAGTIIVPKVIGE